jgi:hypothetical protein
MRTGPKGLLLLPALLLLALTMASGDDGSFDVQFTLAGEGIPDGAGFTLRVHPSWAPRGAHRFQELIEAGFYDDNRFFRVLDGM